MYRLGLDIGGTKINIGVLDGSGNLLATQKLRFSVPASHQPAKNDYQSFS